MISFNEILISDELPSKSQQPGRADQNFANTQPTKISGLTRSALQYLPDRPAKQTVYGWVFQKKIPYHKKGKKLQFLKLKSMSGSIPIKCLRNLLSVLLFASTNADGDE